MAAVLARVQKEVGPEAKIGSAQRVRSGGVMGFFQREKFEVIVEIPDASELAEMQAEAAATAAESTTPEVEVVAGESAENIDWLLALAEEVNREEKQADAELIDEVEDIEAFVENKIEEVPVVEKPVVEPIAETPVVETVATPVASAPVAEEAVVEPAVIEPVSTETVAEEVVEEPGEVEPVVEVIAEPVVAVEAPAETLPEPAAAAAAAEVAEPVEVIAAEPVIEEVETPAVFESTIEKLIEETRTPEESQEIVTLGEENEQEESIISTEKESFAEVLSRVAFQADMKSEPEAQEREVITPEFSINESPIETETEKEPVIDMSTVVTTPETTYDEHPWADGERSNFLDVKPVNTVPATAAPPFRTRATDHPLATLGLPAPFIPTTSDFSSLEKALTVSLERLPQPPDVRPSKGSVIAVVGELVEALDLAESLARKWGRPVEEVVLASQLYKGRSQSDVLRNVRSAEDARRSWSRRNRPTVVAIDAYPGSHDTQWAEHILTALEPIATYGVADATRKSEDIAAWASQLGGVDCLAVNHVDETVSPASILGTGIPIERIDGRKATPAYWAMLLAERLTAA